MGRQMVETFVKEGASVSYSARNVDDSDFADFHKTLPSSNKARAIGTSLDVSSKDALEAWVKAAAERVGRIDSVIANGIYTSMLQKISANFDSLLTSITNAHGWHARSLDRQHQR